MQDQEYFSQNEKFINFIAINIKTEHQYLVKMPRFSEHKGQITMYSILWLFNTIIDVAIFFIIAQFILSWLLVFGVIQPHQPVVASLRNFLESVTEPIYRPVRSIIPALGGFDLSPMIVLILLQFLRMFVLELAGAF